MRKVVLFILAIVVLGSALAIAQQAQTVLIYRWQDAQGKFFYTDDYSMIPSKFRNTVVVGRFAVEGSVLLPQKAQPKDSSDAVEQGIVVLQDSYQIKENFLHIEGRVKNLLDKTIAEVRANIEFYDKYAQLLSAPSVELMPPVLRPGEIGKFTVSVPLTSRFHYYKTEIVYRER